ncbi:DUF4345 domain-containing protein [Peteryoungia ipomoeae]|uniref:DUF4345 domain-containing protein n=1 Tax=Peteryoungia ipomoeae TaxID=1210932 RepID=A0A4S8P3Y8_9HYPH|nr:DUF4345 domain-containing protein [Peteryoungia ipomoeae]THV22409.1 DUF4345 domain-containing protein [Peteryoungia ipomoeae]
MEFYFPTEPGEQLAFLAATIMALVGCFVLLAPGLAMRMAGLDIREGRNDGYGAVRSAGGLLAGFCGTALLLAQPMVYLALGAALGLSVFSRILSIMSDGRSSWRVVPPLVVQAATAALVLSYVFGLI